MRGNKVFLDTNIIIYAYDVSAGKKHEIAKKIVMDLWDSRLGVISTQVLQEFFVTITKKIPKPIEIKLAKEIMRDLLKWDVVVNDGGSILEATGIHALHKYPFWDSQIIQSAIRGGASLLLSEDLSDGQTVDGVEIKNPFHRQRSTLHG
ncbi:MAG: PIN domain-containing protein [Nitrospirota bacterium]